MLLSHSSHGQNPQSFLLLALEQPSPQAVDLAGEASGCLWWGDKATWECKLLDQKNGDASGMIFPEFHLLSVYFLSRQTNSSSGFLGPDPLLWISFPPLYLFNKFLLITYKVTV